MAGEMRRELRTMVRRGAREGLLRGTFGNVSIRVPGGLLITPTATDYLKLRAEDFVAVDLASGQAQSGRPSSELPLHLAIYRALPEAQAVWHDHTPFAVAAGLVADDVPIYTGEGHGLIGRTLPVAPYLPSGSAELADAVAKTFERTGAGACLMRNHGAVAIGPSLFAAYSCAIATEEAAMHFLLTRGLAPATLDEEEAAAIRTAFAAYRMR
ncbi:MAG: class II aldolase/adducin family protein [Thermaerobacter sp.]|nr:class II aldolase/adducin family protein [Thermaerobacter sp.]